MADVQLSEEALRFLEEAEKSIKKIEPVNSGLITNPDENDFNFWNKAGRLTLSAGQGVVNAVEESGDFIDDATLVQICDQLELTDNQIEHITHLDLDDIKHFRGENK